MSQPPANDASAYNPGNLVIPSYTVPPHPSEANSPKKQRSPCCRRIICVSIILGIAVAATVGILVSLTGNAGPQAIFIQEDPPGLEETNRWSANTRSGLDVFVMNSCEDRWTPIFDEYIQAWDNGSPDALTLTSKKFPHDPECASHTGRVNVCNGDYGNTNWRGVNTAFLRNGFVQHSVAKLNDYHLDRESQNQKRYTMCHELGHAFGLPHTDTNYYNFDRGDCLDYTIRPRNNLDPGEFNFNLLFSLYGSTNGDGPTAGVARTNGNDQRLGDPFDGDDRRLEATANDEDTTDNIMEAYASVRECLEEASCSECIDEAFFDYQHVRMLHENEQGEACEFHLGQGYTIQTHKLLVR